MSVPDYERRKSFDAYYYSFDATGCEAIDRILEAVARAGKAYHHTEMWSECDLWWGEEPQEQCIEKQAIKSAKEVAAKDAEIDRLKAEVAVGVAEWKKVYDAHQRALAEIERLKKELAESDRRSGNRWKMYDAEKQDHAITKAEAGRLKAEVESL